MRAMEVVQQLLTSIDSPGPFLKTDYPYPLNQSLFGRFNLEELRKRAAMVTRKELTGYLTVVLALTEVVEACQPDRDRLFLGDREVRARLVDLNRDTGWVLLSSTSGPKAPYQ